MKPTVTARTTMFNEPLGPLVRGSDGRLISQPGVSPVNAQPMEPIPYTQASNPLIPAPSGWMDQDTVIPGFKNSLVLFGVAALAVGVFFMSRKQVIA